MSDQNRSERGRGHAAGRARPAFWQLVLVGVSIVLMIAGAGIGFMSGGFRDADRQDAVAHGVEPGTASAAPMADGLASGFLPGGPGTPGTPEVPRIPGSDGAPDEASSEQLPPGMSNRDLLSPALFKLGFGFFIGFSMAYAVRMFMKISLVAAGFFAMLLFGLQYAGIIEVNWNVMADRYDSVAAWIGAQTQSFGAFVSGALPGAGAALAGAAIGLRRG